MFLGTYTPKLDDKGRFFLPAKFREQLATGLVITRQQDRCLAIWPTEAFLAEVANTANGPSTVRGVRDYQRMVASGASDELPDSQGRVVIPPPLRTYAGLEKEIVVIGAFNRLEVWDQAAWADYSAAQEEAFAALDEGMPSEG
ncbi:MAG: cell division/cell wall cluster transcriptional repressor MraZ [Actinobacteria bacterium HGW-Actinobacteria-2]|nr:MAG: cell division/cell wall cluster transcriptional repressor MraZ [Actinobacteria bacterium HGW-Actinobacteria-2]